MKLSRTFRPLALAGLCLGLLLCAAVRSQAQHRGGGPGGSGGFGGMGGGDMGGDRGRGASGDSSRDGMSDRDSIAPPMRSGPLLAPPGRWWDDNKTGKKLSLSHEQKQRMDDIFDANKGALLNGFTSLQREEMRLNAMSSQDLQDETKVFAAIDRVAQARTDLAKEIAHFQMQLREQLSPAQLGQLDKEVASLK